MLNQEKIIIPIDEVSNAVLFDIEKKYNLEETVEEIVEVAKNHEPLKVNIILNLTRDFMIEKISNNEFLDILHKKLKTSEGVTKNIALDIFHNLIPLLKKIPESRLVEYNKKQFETEKKSKIPKENIKETGEQQKQEAFARAKEELLRKLRLEHGIEEPASAIGSGVARPEVTDVEDNAKLIEHQQEKDVALPAEKAEEKVDPYKESVE